MRETPEKTPLPERAATANRRRRAEMTQPDVQQPPKMDMPEDWCLPLNIAVSPKF